MLTLPVASVETCASFATSLATNARSTAARRLGSANFLGGHKVLLAATAVPVTSVKSSRPVTTESLFSFAGWGKPAAPMAAAGVAQEPDTDNPGAGLQFAEFGAGCFWGVELAFQRVPGVVKTEVGYTQGINDKPTYEQVCSGRTGHVEAVRVVYDPKEVSYEGLLDVFWGRHDPTTLNRQGGDVGTQYRSGIYVFSPEQEEIAKKSLEARQAQIGRKIVTEIMPAKKWYPAESYHQQYLAKGGRFGMGQSAAKGCTDPIRAASGGAESGGGGGASDNKFLRVSIQSVALALVFGGAAAFLRMLLSALPPDFLSRWKKLFAEQPHFDPKAAVEARRATAIYDCHGDLIATVVPGGFGGRRKDASKGQAPLKPTEVPAVMWQAVIATEDRRFFEHQGFDPKGLTRAIMSLARTGGGSTITQQLVKNVFLSNERRWTRKLVEIILAVIIERRMTKWDILHLYLNKIYWGHGVTGLEAASALYFGKHPSLLTLGECAMLAGIIPAPELLSPYRDPSRGRKPQARALRRMVEAGFLDITTATEAMQQPLRLGSEAKHGTSGPWRAPFFVSEVLYELAQKYGREEVVRGGLQVHTTLDLTMQDAGEKVVGDGTREYDQEREAAAQRDIAAIAMKLEELRGRRQQQILATVAAAAVKRSAEFRKKNGQTQKTVSEMMADETAAVARTLERFAALERTLTTAMQRYENELKNAQAARLEGAMVAMDPLSGAVRVLVGGRDYYESCFNRATQALRPPGSTFKPVVYLTALAEGITKDYVLVDEPYEVGGFAPENYDRKFRGPVTLEESLLKSLNVPTVKLCAEIGVDKVRDRRVDELGNVCTELSWATCALSILKSDFNTELGNECTELGNECTELGNECTELGNECTELGNECTELGNECTELGNECTELGNECTELGNECTELGNECTELGNECTELGNECTELGNECTELGNECTELGNECTELGNECTELGNECTELGNECTELGN
ncbi:unnamed protein product [Closterium sp. Yama58-4]|nr:unnamed protein product [Closterium sp. Yama58-4]